MNGKTLTPKQIFSKVTKRLLKLDKRTFLEQYSLFIGKAQLIELALKQRLVDQYGYSESRIQRWTLGRIIAELEQKGLRKDFIALLEGAAGVP